MEVVLMRLPPTLFLAVLIAGSIFYQAIRLGRTMYQVLEIVAQQIGLGPMGSRP